MKKILLTALFAGLGFTANMKAGDCPPPTIYSGIHGNFTCSSKTMGNIDFQYLVDGEPLTIDFVNPKVEYEPDDLDHENPYYYTYLTLVNPLEEKTDVKAGIYIPSDIGVMSFGTKAVDHSGTTVSINIFELKDYEWIKGEYTIIIPENSFMDLSGNINPAQEIRWTNLTQSVYSRDVSFSPAPGVENLYSKDDMKAVTITFSGTINYNAGNITYGSDNAILSDTNYRIDGNQLILDLSFLPEGIYRIEIDPGFLIVGGEAYFEGAVITYKIWNGLKSAQILSGPSPMGESVTNVELFYGGPISPVGGKLGPLNVYKDEYESSFAFEIPADCISIKEVPYSPGGDTPSTGGDMTSTTETISVLYLDIEKLFEGKTGIYVITIPEGYVESNGLVNPKQQIMFQLYPLIEETSISMKDGIINIIWNGAKYIKDSIYVSAYLTLPNGSSKTLSYKYSFMDSGQMSPITSGIQADLTDIIETNGDGLYTLVIPEAYFEMTIGNETYINREIIYEFTIGDNNPDDPTPDNPDDPTPDNPDDPTPDNPDDPTPDNPDDPTPDNPDDPTPDDPDGPSSGVNALANENGTFTVYTLQGVKILENASSISNLNSGMYIINGHKVVIRK